MLTAIMTNAIITLDLRECIEKLLNFSERALLNSLLYQLRLLRCYTLYEKVADILILHGLSKLYILNGNISQMTGQVGIIQGVCPTIVWEAEAYGLILRHQLQCLFVRPFVMMGEFRSASLQSRQPHHPPEIIHRNLPHIEHCHPVQQCA